MLFLLSLLLMVWVSLRWASHLMSSPADRFWVFVAVLMLQVGGITSLTSLVHQLTPTGWLLVQGLMGALTLSFTGGWRGHALQGVGQSGRRLRSGLAALVGGLSGWGRLLLCVVGAVVLLATVRQGMAPLRNSDDWLYHATRVIHWVQNRSAFPYDAHIFQQNIVPFGSELFFLWPVLLTKSELAGRLVFGMALPLVAVGQYLLLRALRLGQTAALAGVLVLVSTPLVLASTTGLKPEIWAILSLLGLAHWALTVGAAPGPVRCFFLGVFAVLCINVRSFPVVLLPSLVLIVWWASGELSRARRLKFLATGGLCAGLLSALLIPLVFNTINHGHPMGPELAQQGVKAKIEPQVMYTHAVRFAFQSLELPVVPVSEKGRTGFSRVANQAIDALGAGRPLDGEANGFWPGRFVYALPGYAARYSLWGLFWLPVLLVALVHVARNLVSTWPRVRLTDASVLALLAIPLWGAILFGARWMVHSDVPGRFLVGAYALTLTLGITVLLPHLSGRRVAGALAAAAVAYAAFQPVRSLVQEVLQQATPGAAPGVVLDEPFSEVTRSVLPAGSRVLLIGDKDTREYPLFAPDAHYANVVIPWGTGGFDPVRMRRLMDTERVTHVLIHNDQQARYRWLSTEEVRLFAQWLGAETGLREIPLRSPGLRLYEVKAAAKPNETPFGVAQGPSAAPLVAIAPPLRGQVGLDPAMWLTPWPIEDQGGSERGFLWLGQGYAEGLEFALWSRQERDVELRFDVLPGPGLTTPDRRILLLHDDVPARGVRAFRGAASVAVRTRLHAGRNLLSLMALDIATVNPLPNGDARNLVVGLNGVRVEPAPPGPADGREHRGSDEALASSAQLAVGLIHRRQQADGYWFTSHTAGTHFEGPGREMNTYVTALMVDLLGSGSAALAGSLERARHHLRSQIESGGLVRYHGKPGGRANTENSMCTITPDTDDTALVWRLAPGDGSLRPAALETLRRYRTGEGLYQTWLAQPGHTQCLNPGSDPNPPDVAIQMHLLMWLAQVDPPEARSLCNALRKSVGEERLWVYYRRAPLVPVLRQPDMKAAGCELPLPAARTQTDIAGQQIWLDAVRMLVQLEEGNGPARSEVLQLLQELSKDRFTPVRQNPPMLYHNDLSASVSRYYWSEDVGYAIWQRLYQLGVEVRP
ncbi:hypothetical protein [Hydrogenophaga sp. MI9]|uniref:hypothetical protein n=1 Tax=Hydrogenophaga sp. MI9 TaxID=3453719 RepID=UPI003EEE842C